VIRIDKKVLLPVLLLAAFAVTMLWPLIFGGEIYTFRDFGRFYVPIKKAYLERLAHGELCIWLPELNCGTPIHGGLIHAFLYPGNVLLFAGESLGWGLYFAAHIFLAGLGARALARKLGACEEGAGARALARKLGACEEGAFAAAIAYAGSGYLVSQMNHVPYATVAAWAPVIVTLALSVTEGKRRAVPLLAGAFTMAALGGEPFTLLLTIAFTGILVLTRRGGPRFPGLIWIGAAGIVALLLASPTLLPAWDVIPESARAVGFEGDLKGFGSVHPLRLTTVLSPEALGRYQHRFELWQTVFGMRTELEAQVLLGLWIGAVGLIALARAPVRRSTTARVLAITAGVCAILALGDHLGLAPLLTKSVPGLSRFRYADKYWFVVTLAAAPLIGLALPLIRRRTGWILGASGALMAVAIALVLSRPESILTGALPFVLAAGAMFLPRVWRTRALTCVLAAELLFFGVRHHLTADPVRVNPVNSGIGRVLRGLPVGRMFVHFKNVPIHLLPKLDHITVTALRNFESIRGVGEGFSYTLGYDPTEPLSRIMRFFRIHRDTPAPVQTARFHRYLRLTANTHSITTVDLRNDREVTAILEGPVGVRCYQYVDPVPRAVLYGDVVFVADIEEAKEHLDDFTLDPFRTLLVEGEGAPESGGTPRGSVEFIEDSDREVVLGVQSDRPAWLFLSDSYARGWRATVNGEEAEIRPGMIAFRAVRVPQGESTVRFSYEPRWLRIAPVTFGSGVVLLLGLLWWARGGRKALPRTEATEDTEKKRDHEEGGQAAPGPARSGPS